MIPIQLSSFDALIEAMPVDFHAFTSHRKTWERFELNEELRVLNDQIFDGKDAITINRFELFYATLNKKEFVLKTIYWGYPDGMRGTNFDKILSNLNTLSKVLDHIQHDKKGFITEAEFKEYLSQLSGIGISTFTKLLYFMRIRVEKYSALILDRRIIKVLNNNTFQEFDQLSTIRYDSAKERYLDYLYMMENTSYTRYAPDQLEMFLFQFGNNLKHPIGEEGFIEDLD
jgi:hypothetical protein